MKVNKYEIEDSPEGVVAAVYFDYNGEEFVNIDSFEKIGEGLVFVTGGSTYETLVEDADMDSLYNMLDKLYQEILKPFGGISE